MIFWITNFSFLYDKDRERLNYEEVTAHYLYLKLWEKAVIWTIMWIVANVRAFMVARPRFMTVEDTNENWWMTWNSQTCQHYQCQFLPFFNFRAWQKVFFFWSESEMGKECSARCFLQAWNICNSSKNFSRYFSNFSQKMMFISLAVFRVLLLQTLKKSENHRHFDDDKM